MFFCLVFNYEIEVLAHSFLLLWLCPASPWNCRNLRHHEEPLPFFSLPQRRLYWICKHLFYCLICWTRGLFLYKNKMWAIPIHWFLITFYVYFKIQTLSWPISLSLNDVSVFWTNAPITCWVLSCYSVLWRACAWYSILVLTWWSLRFKQFDWFTISE